MYRIVITEVTERTTQKQKWEPLHSEGQRTEYGYAPPIDTVEKVTREVLTQEVETLELPRVIAAVNGIGKRKRTRKTEK